MCTSCHAEIYTCSCHDNGLTHPIARHTSAAAAAWVVSVADACQLRPAHQTDVAVVFVVVVSVAVVAGMFVVEVVVFVAMVVVVFVVEVVASVAMVAVVFVAAVAVVLVVVVSVVECCIVDAVVVVVYPVQVVLVSLFVLFVVVVVVVAGAAVVVSWVCGENVLPTASTIHHLISFLPLSHSSLSYSPQLW